MDIEMLKSMVNVVPYKKLSSFPLGEYKKKVIESKYQYRSNIFAVVEDNFDFVLSMIFQSVERQESLMIFDLDRKIYRGTKNFFKDKNYASYIFSAQKDKLDTDTPKNTYDLWSASSTPEKILVVATVLIYSFHVADDVHFFEEDSFIDLEVSVLACLMSYAITTGLLKENKFEYLRCFLKENSFSKVKELLSDVNDTTDMFFDKIELYGEEEQKKGFKEVKSIIEVLAFEENNEILSRSDYEATTPSLTKSVTFFENSNEVSRAGINVAFFEILYANLLYQEETKGRGYSINVIVNKTEMFDNVYLLDSFIDLSRKYNTNFFIMTEKPEKLPESFLGNRTNFPYLLVRKKLSQEAWHKLQLLELDNLTDKELVEEDAELISTPNSTFKCKKYDTSKHSLYELYYGEF